MTPELDVDRDLEAIRALGAEVTTPEPDQVSAARSTLVQAMARERLMDAIEREQRGSWWQRLRVPGASWRKPAAVAAAIAIVPAGFAVASVLSGSEIDGPLPATPAELCPDAIRQFRAANLPVPAPTEFAEGCPSSARVAEAIALIQQSRGERAAQAIGGIKNVLEPRGENAPPAD